MALSLFALLIGQLASVSLVRKAVIDIRSCEVTEGKLPRKQTKLVLAWAEIHQEELIADWNLASKGELPFQVDPLK